MELAVLGGASIIGYLLNQRQRETNFAEENSVPLDMVADQYTPFNDPRFQNMVGCPGSYPVYNMPGIATSNQGYINYMNQELYESSIAYYKKAISIDSTYSTPIYNLGYSYENLEFYDKAAKYYSKALVYLSNNPSVYNRRGLVNIKLENFYEAIADFKK
jgi:tetratricopeptide (TPR) repeat protein